MPVRLKLASAGKANITRDTGKNIIETIKAAPKRLVKREQKNNGGESLNHIFQGG